MSYEEVKEIKEKYEDELLKLPNVIGTEVGYKEINGEETDELAVRVLVKHKVENESQLDDKHIIPKTLEKGVKTDVDDQEGEITIPPMRRTNEKKRTDKWRPCPYGPSIGHYKITAGTQGNPSKNETEN